MKLRRWYEVKKNNISVRNKAFLFVFVFFIASISSCLIVNADDTKSGYCGIDGGTNISWELSNDGVLTISGEGEMFGGDNNELNKWYKYRNSIEEIIVGDNITTIGSYAFYNCENLKKVTLPNTLKTISWHAFQGCKSLEKIELPDNLESLCIGAFFECSSLSEITLPDKMTDVETYSFYGCSNLEKVVLPLNIKTLGEQVFYGCSKLSDITLPENLEVIDRGCFGKCSSLKKIIIPSKVSKLEYGVFNGCTSLSEITLSENMEILGEEVFRDCPIEKLYLPDSVRSMDTFCVCGCTELKEVSIGNNFEKMGYCAFFGNESLEKVEYRGDIESWMEIDFLCNPTEMAGDLYINGKVVTEVEFKKGTTEIPNRVFHGCKSLNKVTIPETVTKIGDYSFCGCEGLEEIDIPASVTSIGGYAFSGCTGLTEISIPNKVDWIGGDAFSGCTGITELTIPESVTEITYCAFANCSNLKKITLPQNLLQMGYGSFAGCSELSEITLPQTIESIGGSCFSGCKSLTELILPEKIKTIESGTFSQCNNLKIEKLPDSIESIGWWAFEGCSKFELNYIPSSLKTIGVAAFRECSKISNVDLPNSVTEIGEQAFLASGLKSITISGNVKTIERETFEGCNNLKTIVIPETVSEIGQRAFFGSGIEEIVIPKSVKKISSYSFAYCSSLKSITIYNTLETIESGAFCDDSELKSINFIGTKNEWNQFSNDEHIFDGNEAFKNADVSFGYLCGEYLRCSFDEDHGVLTITGHGDMFNYISETELPWYSFKEKITSVVFDGSINKISNYAFYGLNSVESISIPDSVTQVGDLAFGNSKNLKSIYIGNGVSEIGEKVFAECETVEKISFGESIENIDKSTFKDTEGLKEISVSSNNSHFSVCDSFLIKDSKVLCAVIPCSITENCVIPDSANEISENAFENCECVKRITISHNVNLVEKNAFTGCNNIENVEYIGKQNEWITLIESENFGSGNNNVLSADIVYSGYSCGDNLKGQYIEKSKTLVISGYGEMYEYTYETIPWADLRNYLENVEICGKISEFSDFAFSGCGNLREFEIPDSVSEISAYMLDNCGIEKILIGNSITSIGDGAFQNCTSLEEIVVGDNITYIGENAFQNTKFYNDAGNYDNRLLYLDNSNKYLITAVNYNIHQNFNEKTNSRTILIASGAFKNIDCEALILNDGLKYIGSSAFEGSEIKSIDFPATVVSCAEDALKNSSVNTVNYDSDRAKWLKMNINYDGTVYYTLKTDDGRVEVIYCDDDLPEEAGNVEVCGAPNVTVENITDSTQSQLRNSRFYNKDVTHIFEDMNISISNRYGAVQPRSGKTVRLRIKASDEFANMICQGVLDGFSEISSVKFSNVSIEGGVVRYYQGNKIFEMDAKTFAAEKRFKIYHWYSEPFDDNFDGEDEIYFSYYLKDISLDDGFIVLDVPHFSEFAMATDFAEFEKTDYSVIAGEKIKVEFLHNSAEPVSYCVSDSSIAEIDNDGFVSAKSNGEIVVYAFIDGVCVSQCNVNVSKPEIEIEGYRESRNIECKQTVTFYATGTIPGNTSVFWYYNGDKVSQGESYTVSNPSNDYTIQCKAFDDKGKLIAESKIETVYVKHSFFDLLIAFFKGLFGLIPEIKQR